MATIPKIVNIGRLTNNFRDSLERRAGITNFNSDSVARSLYLPLVNELGRINNENRRAFQAIQIESATGSDLDTIAKAHGITRLSPTFSQTEDNEKNFIFFADTTFGGINNGNDITIPAGTKVTIPNTIANNVVYETVSSATLQAAAQMQVVTVRSLSAGSESNVGSGVLRQHDFTNYVDSSSASLQCTNVYPIVSGRDLESDDSLRFRVTNNYASIVRDSENTLFLRALEVPGVLNLKVLPNYYGIGTIGVFIFGPNGVVSQSILSEVNRKLGVVKPPGTRIIATAGISVHVDVEINVTLNTEINAVKQLRIENSIRRAVSNHFSNGSIDRLSTNELRTVILNSNNDIRNVLARDGSNNVFKSIYIRRAYGEGGAASERFQLDSSVLSIEEYEYLTAGTISVIFGVQQV